MNMIMYTILTIVSSLILNTSTLHSIQAIPDLTSKASHLQKTLPPQKPNIHTTLQKLSNKAPQLDKNVLKMALAAYTKAKEKGNVKKPVLTVIDYSLPSNKQRMWVFDLKKHVLLYHTHVAHGKNSGSNNVPRSFSNQHSSRQSSLGTYVTKGTYMGNNGYSLNIHGLEPGFNDNAYKRRVVIHGAWYVEPTFIRKAGRAGHSWGCPAIAKTLAKPLINTIKNGSVIFAYYPNRAYLSKSSFAKA